MFFAQNYRQPAPNLAFDGDIGTSGTPVSSWQANCGGISVQSSTTNRPTTTALNTSTGLLFDGIDDYLSFAGQAVSKNGAATLMTIFKTDTTIPASVIVSQTNNTVNNDYWEFGIGADSRLYVSSNNAGTILTIQGSTLLQPSTIYKTLLCFDGVDYYLQLNDVEENPLTITSIGTFDWLGRVGGTRTFTVGATTLNSGNTRFFKGIIGGIYFWNRDLTE